MPRRKTSGGLVNRLGAWKKVGGLAVAALVAALVPSAAYAVNTNTGTINVAGNFSTVLTVSGTATLSGSGEYRQGLIFGLTTDIGFNIPTTTINVGAGPFNYNNVPALGTIQNLNYDNHTVVPNNFTGANLGLITTPQAYAFPQQTIGVNVPVLGLFDIPLDLRIQPFGTVNSLAFGSGGTGNLGSITPIGNGNQGTMTNTLPGAIVGQGTIQSNGTLTVNIPLIGTVTLISNTQVLPPTNFSLTNPGANLQSGTVATTDLQPDPIPPGGNPPYPHDMNVNFAFGSGSQNTNVIFNAAINYFNGGTDTIRRLNANVNFNLNFTLSNMNVNLNGNVNDGISNFAPFNNPGGPYFLNAVQQSVALNGSGGDPDGDAITYRWTTATGATLIGPSPFLGLPQSGITSASGAGSFAQVSLTTIDSGTPGNAGLESPSNSSFVIYNNTAPSAANAGFLNLSAFTTTVNHFGTFTDLDLFVTGVPSDFDTHTFSWRVNGNLIGNAPTAQSNPITLQQALNAGINHPNESITGIFTVFDKSGASTSANFGVGYANTVPTVNGGPDLAFNASQASRTATAVVNDPDLAVNALKAGFETTTYQWRSGGNPFGLNPNAAANTITIQQAIAAGMNTTTATGVMNVTATDFVGTSGFDTVLLTYSNAGPTATGFAVGNPNGTASYSFTITDIDLGMNALQSNFEFVNWELGRFPALTPAQVGDGFRNGTTAANFVGPNIVISGNLTAGQILAIFGASEGTFTGYLNAVDRAGVIFSLPFTFTITAIPEPATVVLWGVGAVGIFAISRRKKRSRVSPPVQAEALRESG